VARVLVTGGDGFVGRHVVGAFRDGGHEVRWTTLAPGEDPAGITVDLRVPGALDGHLDGVDAVVHLAARAGGIGFQRTPDPTVFADNRALTDSVLAAAAAAGVGRVFLASSAVVYRPRTGRPHLETDPLVALEDHPSPYAWSKVTDEVAAGWSMAAHPGTSVVVGRFANVYGPGGPDGDDTGTVVHTLIRRAGEAAAAGEPLRVWGDPSAVRSFVFVADVARAVALLATSADAAGAYNIDTGVPIDIGSVARTVAAAIDPGLSIETDASRPSDVPYRVTDPGRIGGLGFVPEVDFLEGIRRCVAARN
jgi:nucleoside-diphosphate-sugar epimerase